MPGLLTRYFARPTRASLDRFRDARLRRLVRHAHERVPHYRRLFDEHGVDPGSIRGVADIGRVPVTTRAVLQGLVADEIVARGVDRSRLVERWSSGSTGRQIAVRRTWWEDRTVAMFRKRAERQVGISSRDHLAWLKLDRGLHPNDVQWPIRVARAMGFFRMTPVYVTRQPLELVSALRALRPDAVNSFPSVLLRVAEVVGPGGLADLGVHTAISGGEVLTPRMRATIEEAFGARVVDKYGTIETDLTAIECLETGQMHVCDDNVIVEVLRDGEPVAPGECGEVVMTALHAFAMPLIRYRIGDVAAQGDPRCSCGAPWSTIRDLRGRMLDYFPLPDGRLYHPFNVTTPMLAANPWIRRYQVTQERVDRVVVRLVAEPAPGADQLAAVQAHFEAELGPEVEIEVRVVGDLPAGPSGKFRRSRSLVRSVYDEDLDWQRVG